MVLWICKNGHVSSVHRPAYGDKVPRCHFCPEVVVETEVEIDARQ